MQLLNSPSAIPNPESINRIIHLSYSPTSEVAAELVNLEGPVLEELEGSSHHLRNIGALQDEESSLRSEFLGDPNTVVSSVRNTPTIEP
ncbi:unnamed protein product, partial [Cyprideis torosa]